MDTKMRKINFNTYVHSKTASRLFWRPQHHVDDIYDMRRSCCMRWKTSGRRRLDSSSWLLKVPNYSNVKQPVTALIRVGFYYYHF